jgi:hypothetical protein
VCDGRVCRPEETLALCRLGDALSVSSKPVSLDGETFPPATTVTAARRRLRCGAVRASGRPLPGGALLGGAVGLAVDRRGTDAAVRLAFAFANGRTRHFTFAAGATVAAAEAALADVAGFRVQLSIDGIVLCPGESLALIADAATQISVRWLPGSLRLVVLDRPRDSEGVPFVGRELEITASPAAVGLVPELPPDAEIYAGCARVDRAVPLTAFDVPGRRLIVARFPCHAGASSTGTRGAWAALSRLTQRGLNHIRVAEDDGRETYRVDCHGPMRVSELKQRLGGPAHSPPDKLSILWPHESEIDWLPDNALIHWTTHADLTLVRIVKVSDADREEIIDVAGAVNEQPKKPWAICGGKKDMFRRA